MGKDMRQVLERKRRDLLALVQRMERSGPWVISVQTDASLEDDLGRTVDRWPLASFSEPLNLTIEIDGVTGCDVRYRIETDQLRALFFFRAQRELNDAELGRLVALVRAIPQPRKVPRLLAGYTLRTRFESLALESKRLSDADYIEEQTRARKQFSVIDAEIDAQLSALPTDTAQEDRDRKLFASARELMIQVAQRANIGSLDGSLASLDVCTELLVSLALLDRAQRYLALDADRYAQMVLVACAIYAGDTIRSERPECRLQLEFNETGALREVEVIDETDEESLRMLRLLTLCMKCAESSPEHDLRRDVSGWLAGS